MSQLEEQFRSIESLPPINRGKAFERLLASVIKEGGIHPSLSFRPAGEEIDGSFWWGGRTYLIEAKWTAAPVAASSIYMFKGKVDGKFAGTIGIFISMSGYSDDAVAALQHGKALSVVLWDRDDFEATLNGTSFQRILEAKLYAAGRTGEIYLPWARIKQANALLASTNVIERRSDDATQPTVFVLVEGESDAREIRKLIEQRLGAQASTLLSHLVLVPLGFGGWLMHTSARGMIKLLADETSGLGLVAVVADREGANPAGVDHIRRIYEEGFQTLPAGWHAEAFITDLQPQDWSEDSIASFMSFLTQYPRQE